MKLAVFEGDGIGPEIVGAALRALGAAADRFGLGLDIRKGAIGLQAHAETGSTFPQASRDLAGLADGIILGPLSTSEYPNLPGGGVNASAVLRKELDLYANIRPMEALPDLSVTGRPFRTTLFRENTEGFYAVRTMHAGTGEFAPDADTGFALRKITAAASRRIAEVAFAHAAANGLSVCAVHKANVLPITDGIFLRECRTVARRYPAAPYREEIVDATAAGLVSDPLRYEVVVTTNLFGDILSNQIAALGGGLGLAGSLNVGDRHAMAQAAHGSAPDIAGRNVANPTSMLMSVTMLLTHLGAASGRRELAEAGTALRDAVVQTLAQGRSGRTRDLDGALSTDRFTQEVIARMQGGPSVPDTARGMTA